MTGCIYCEIVAGNVPSKEEYRDDLVLAIHDIDPQAPLHLLVLPRKHVPNLPSVAEARDDATVAATFSAAARLGSRLAPEGFRLIVNTGADGGQTIEHFHVHVLGGRQLTWPPG